LSGELQTFKAETIAEKF